jgi:hypothetical protein
MDTATAKLAVELQLEDINDLLDGLYDEYEIPTATHAPASSSSVTTFNDSCRSWRVRY